MRTARAKNPLLHQERGQRHRSPFPVRACGSWCLALILAACQVGLGLRRGGIQGIHIPSSCQPGVRWV